MTFTLTCLVLVALVAVVAICAVTYAFNNALSLLRDEAAANRGLHDRQRALVSSTHAQAHELALSTVRGSADAVASAVSSATYGRAPTITPEQVERELIEEAAQDLVDPYLVDDTDPFDHAVIGAREDAALIVPGDSAPWLNGSTRKDA